MEAWNVILGVDVSKKTLDTCCAERRLPTRIDNNSEGFGKFKKWCKDNDIDLKSTFVVLEFTGGYEYRFIQFCESQCIAYCRVPGLEIKQSLLGMVRGKSDKADAYSIGRYGEEKIKRLVAYIDVFNLTPANLLPKSENDIWIITYRQKTNTPVKVPLLSKALAIVEKYKGHPQALAKGKIFPTLSNQKLNSYLKEIADMCSITKPLTFHIARHTFATTVTLTNGVPIGTVSKLLGHLKISTTQIYAKVIESKLGDDMFMLSQKLR